MAAALHLSVVTLGVRDLQSMREFYGQLGLVEAGVGSGSLYMLGDGLVLVLVPMDELAVAAASGGSACTHDGAFSDTVLPVRVADDHLLDVLCGLARGAGGTVLSEPAPNSLGWRLAHVADPEGNVWRLTCAPAFSDEAVVLVSSSVGDA